MFADFVKKEKQQELLAEITRTNGLSFFKRILFLFSAKIIYILPVNNVK